jgi:hypothetical protein
MPILIQRQSTYHGFRKRKYDKCKKQRNRVGNKGPKNGQDWQWLIRALLVIAVRTICLPSEYSIRRSILESQVNPVLSLSYVQLQNCTTSSVLADLCDGFIFTWSGRFWSSSSRSGQRGGVERGSFAICLAQLQTCRMKIVRDPLMKESIPGTLATSCRGK